MANNNKKANWFRIFERIITYALIIASIIQFIFEFIPLYVILLIATLYSVFYGFVCAKLGVRSTYDKSKCSKCILCGNIFNIKRKINTSLSQMAEEEKLDFDTSYIASKIQSIESTGVAAIEERIYNDNPTKRNIFSQLLKIPCSHLESIKDIMKKHTGTNGCSQRIEDIEIFYPLYFRMNLGKEWLMPAFSKNRAKSLRKEFLALTLHDWKNRCSSLLQAASEMNYLFITWDLRKLEDWEMSSWLRQEISELMDQFESATKNGNFYINRLLIIDRNKITNSNKSVFFDIYDKYFKNTGNNYQIYVCDMSDLLSLQMNNSDIDLLCDIAVFGKLDGTDDKKKFLLSANNKYYTIQESVSMDDFLYLFMIERGYQVETFNYVLDNLRMNIQKIEEKKTHEKLSIFIKSL